MDIPKDILYLEKMIDRLDGELVPLKTFILPGGSFLASQIHVARAVCRRAERKIVELAEKEDIQEEVLIYINRLSDFLFVLARWVNHKEGIPDVPWEKK